MRYYFAPMEGLTDSTFRLVHHRHFPGVDRYYMPFLSPTMHHCLTKKEERELPMADTLTFTAIPQLLTKNPEDFLWAAARCADRGYTQVNLNIGCPSGTVVAKGKGAGMLADPEGLDRFLEAVFANSPLPVSVKTRVGMTDDAEFQRLMEIFNRYPITELIIHPRVRKDFYKEPVRMTAFAYAADCSTNPLCYNGDLCTPVDIARFRESYPQVEAVMIGRGLIADPGLLDSTPTTVQRLERYHDDLLDSYITSFGSPRNAMFRMKEHWHHLACRFDGGEKLFKSLRKTTDIQDFRRLTREIFHSLPLKPR